MSSSMLLAVIAVPATDPVEPPDYATGRRMIEKIEATHLFEFEDPESELDQILEDFGPDADLDDEDWPTLATARKAGLAIIDALEKALDSQETETIEVAGYRLFVSGGPSFGDSPTGAAEAIWNAGILPASVLSGMGFIPDHSKPLSRTNGLRKGLTDTDVVDAIALGLGTKPEWSGADDLEWIADAIGEVREHPGDKDPVAYAENFTQTYSFDPLRSKFLAKYVSEDVDQEEDQDDETDDDDDDQEDGA